MEIGDRVRVIVGNNKGIEGTYLGKQNNANWYVVDMDSNAGLMFVNPEEIEKVEEPQRREPGMESEIPQPGEKITSAAVGEDGKMDFPYPVDTVEYETKGNKRVRKPKK